MDDRRTAMAYAAMRVSVGTGIAVLPGPVLRALVGDDARRPAFGYVGRILGVRDALIGAGGLAALATGDRAAGWLAAGAVADAVDAVATVRSWPHLDRRGRVVAVPLALGGAAAGGWLAIRVRGRRPG